MSAVGPITPAVPRHSRTGPPRAALHPTDLPHRYTLRTTLKFIRHIAVLSMRYYLTLLHSSHICPSPSTPSSHNKTDLSDGAVTTRPSSAPSPPADGPLPSADAAAAGLLEVTWPGRRLIHFPRAGSVLLTCTFQVGIRFLLITCVVLKISTVRDQYSRRPIPNSHTALSPLFQCLFAASSACPAASPGVAAAGPVGVPHAGPGPHRPRQEAQHRLLHTGT